MPTQSRNDAAVSGSETMIDVARDGAIRRGTGLFRGGLLLIEKFFNALNRSRARQAAQVIRRHRFLIEEARHYQPRRDNAQRATIRELPATPSPSSRRT